MFNTQWRNVYFNQEPIEKESIHLNKLTPLNVSAIMAEISTQVCMKILIYIYLLVHIAT